jgi:GGDEF domain-containing protein
VLAQGIEDAAVAVDVAGRFTDAIEAPIDLPTATVRVSASIGTRFLDDTAEIAAAIRDADRAMSTAKGERAAASGRARRRA